MNKNSILNRKSWLKSPARPGFDPGHSKPVFKFHISTRGSVILMSLAFVLGFIRNGLPQSLNIESDLERLMLQYEERVLKTYQEKQALSAAPVTRVERAVFDSVISIYTEKVLEIYETLNRIKGFTLENYRQVAARSLIFRALAFVEDSDDNPEIAGRACADYRRALLLTKHNKIPIISQQLPYEVWIGDRLFTRLADLLDEKDHRFVLLRCMRKTVKKEKKKK